MTTDLNAQIDAWLAQDPDPSTAAELRVLRSHAEVGDEEAAAELAAAFSGPLEFGTAGLRGPLGPGPARMNRVVVTQAARGFADWLANHGHRGGAVIIGYDARHNSETFARDTAEVMAGAGFQPLLCATHLPTPVVAFGIQHYQAVAGVVVTASHNPPADNGYKVYLGDGSQIVPPTDTEIAQRIASVASAPLSDIERGQDVTIVGDDLVSAYCARAAMLVTAEAPRDVTWVHTAMHGVGAEVMERAAAAAGFPAPRSVAEQREPDPDFPTVAFPNPEEAGAIDLAVELAAGSQADVVIANDPDADRCAVAAVVGGSWRMLTGNELGALLADDALRHGREGTYACSVVSSTLLRHMAQAYGQPFAATLTGFKWIGRVPGLAFGFEEAIGYCCDPGTVPDKDGITAALRVLAIAAELKAESRSIADRLAEIVRRYGLFATDQLSVRVEDLGIIARAMETIRAQPPQQLLGSDVTVTDLALGGALPVTNAMEFTGERVHVVVRPSGTEPKLKCYLEYRQAPEESADVGAARARADEQLAALRQEMSAVLGL